MITIPVKIAKEDKVIMLEALNCLQFPTRSVLIKRSIMTETYYGIVSKLRASQHNNKNIRLSLVETESFMNFLSKIYATIGPYEFSNAYILLEEINTEIEKAFKKLVND